MVGSIEPLGEIYVCPHCGRETDIRVGIVPKPDVITMICGKTVREFPVMDRPKENIQQFFWAEEESHEDARIKKNVAIRAIRNLACEAVNLVMDSTPEEDR